MNSKLLILISLFLYSFSLFAQDEKEDKPVRFAFESTYLINNQTALTPYKGSLNFQMQHRFGLVENGITDIFGIYASANTRLGLNYGITDKLMISAGTTRDYKLQDINWKYQIFQQTESGSMPVFLTYYGNFVIDAREDEVFYPEENYRFIHRLSYFTQLIVARKFSDAISLQAAPNFIYFNAVGPDVNNIHYGISASGRAKFAPSLSFIAEYDQLLSKNDAFDVYPNLSFGLEIGTSTHAFQIYLSNYNKIIPQHNFVLNTNDPMDGKFLIGFNIMAIL